MGWDILNRMTSYQAGGVGGPTTYAYRADGMRTSKTYLQNRTTYRYDGQMGIQDTEVAGYDDEPVFLSVTDYGLGARGIDVMLRTDGNGTSVGYPVYDLHGNMVATLAKSGTGWCIGNERSFDAWGNVRTGSGVNTGRYCANLGHKQDDESGLTYMRARYYEGASGRFVSEDQGRQGHNWFVYCGNNPISRCDYTGRSWWEDVDKFLKPVMHLVGELMILLGSAIIMVSIVACAGPASQACLAQALEIAIMGVAIATLGQALCSPDALLKVPLKIFLADRLSALRRDMQAMLKAAQSGEKTLAGPAVAGMVQRGFELMAACLAVDLISSEF